MNARVRFREELDKRGVSAYRIVQIAASKVSPKAVYGLAAGKTKRVDLDTLGAVAEALEEASGEPVSVADLLEFVPTEEEAVSLEEEQRWLDASAADLRASLTELEADVPLEEHRAWLDAFAKAPTV